MISKEALEMASMAINAKIVDLDKKYPQGTSGYALREKYQVALYEVNTAIGSANEG
ncbi:MAG: hypothetical protein Unbinned7865contig1001_20 [Prokaryotic dsDNA virus sp.]|nr:MAG: hypothetical protein Unbinned7865contig1001_20 [Prokaryotic dsDNA virus sp.]|tara:strand:- start:26814 stop:26981 length:168 start_codon:yes stop_codon:yes gene_type:complete